MSNKKDKRNKPSRPAASATSAKQVGSSPNPSASSKVSAPTPQEIERALESASAAASVDDLMSATPGNPPVQIDLADAWRKLETARLLWEKQKLSLQQAQADAEEAKKTFEAKEDELNEAKRQHHHELEAERAQAKVEFGKQTGDLADRENKVDQREIELSKREVDVAAMARDLAEREVNAKAGFFVQNRQALISLEQQIAELTQQLTSADGQAIEQQTRLVETLSRERKEQADLLDQMRKRALQEVDDQRDQGNRRLGEWEQALAKLESDLKLQKERQTWEADLLVDTRRHLDRRAEQLAAEMIAKLEGDLREAREREGIAAAERDRRVSELIQHEEFARRFGDRSPAEILAYVDQLEVRVRSLDQQLAQRPEADAALRLTTLQAEREQWVLQREEMFRQSEQDRAQLAQRRVGVIELEAVQDEKRTLEISRDNLRQQLSELDEEKKKQEAQRDDRPVFPKLAEMDQSQELQDPVTVEGLPGNSLARLAERLRDWIGFDAKTGKELFYEAQDIRSFLGGLATSQLMILQGISGIGKSSLPVNLARAIGAGYTIVAVQAGWRDRQDLIGHYNSFRNVFQEETFLRGLYEARCPKYSKRLNFIILDEMNLSYPEQYFADLLSALEQTEPDARRIELMTQSLANPPKEFMKDRQSLRIPDNVWFIGTANQDETTRTMADKTYDRAHVLDLPSKRPTNFKPDRNAGRPPILSWDKLSEAFNQAIANPEHSAAAGNAVQYLEDKLHDPLRTRLKVGWGNRLEGQLRKYVPVVMAAGGTKGEALDYVLAMKILRKIRDKHDTQLDALESLKKKLETTWPEFDSGYKRPVKCLEIMDAEIERKQEGR